MFLNYVKIIFKKVKKYYFNIFLNKHIKNQNLNDSAISVAYCGLLNGL